MYHKPYHEEWILTLIDKRYLFIMVDYSQTHFILDLLTKTILKVHCNSKYKVNKLEQLEYAVNEKGLNILIQARGG